MHLNNLNAPVLNVLIDINPDDGHIWPKHVVLI